MSAVYLICEIFLTSWAQTSSISVLLPITRVIWLNFCYCNLHFFVTWVSRESHPLDVRHHKRSHLIGALVIELLDYQVEHRWTRFAVADDHKTSHAQFGVVVWLTEDLQQHWQYLGRGRWDFNKPRGFAVLVNRYKLRFLTQLVKRYFPDVFV